MAKAIGLVRVKRVGLVASDASVRPLLGGLLALAAAMGIGRFAFTPILPAMERAIPLDPAQAGLLASANYAGYLAGALLLTAVASRLPQLAALRASLAAVAAATALMAATSGLAAWGVVRFVAGFAGAGVFVLASGLVLDDLRRRGAAAQSGWLFSGVGLGIVVSGAVVAATRGALGWRGDWALLASLAAVAIVPCWRWTPRPTSAATLARRSVTLSAMSTFEAPRAALALLVGAYLLESLGYVVTGTFLPAIVERTPGLAGLGADVWIVVGLAAMPAGVVWSAVAGRVGYAFALAAAFFLQAIGIVLPLTGSAGAAFASAALFGATFVGITTLILTFAGRLSGGRSAALIGLLTAIYGTGQMVGPALAGIAATRLAGFGPALVGAAAIVLGGGALATGLRPFDPLRRARPSATTTSASTTR